jgi:SAM-dependent methyltransferase
MERLYRLDHPGRPWLTPAANEILSGYLKGSDIGLEFGSGRGTIWFSKRVKHITSVEHNRDWYKTVKQMLREESLSNVTYHHLPKDKDVKDGGESRYVNIVEDIETESIDFVLVDGVYRDFCAQKALRVLRPGCVLIIDDVNRYLPSTSFSPNSRTFEQGPDGPIWEEVCRSIGEWRSIWTSSGVSDTAFFFKPCRP